MRGNRRKVTVRLIETENINNQRLAEYFAQKYYKKRGIGNENI